MLYHILSYENTNLLKIDNIGFSADPKNNQFGPGKRSLYLIHYVIAGNGSFNGNAVRAGQGFLITPNMYEHYYPDPQTPWKFLWITSRDSAMEEIFEQYHADKTTNIFEYNFISHLQNLTQTIQQNHNKIYTPTELLEIFLSIFNLQNKTHSKQSNTAEQYYDYAVNYLQSNLFRRICVSDLTQNIGITQQYLYAIFKKQCGMSPQKYIHHLKLNEAKRLLRETSLSITEIANSLGYDDVLYFSKFFSYNIGVSPSRYRNS